VIIAIGSNLPADDGASPLQNCEWALRTVASLAGISGAVRSRWYSSAPWPPSAQPRYINGAMRAAWAGSPEQLLAALQRVELEAGRKRGVANAARTLDLDIIDMNGLVRSAPAPILPHPRAHLRAFVLAPLRDIAPSWIHPTLAKTVTKLLAPLDQTDLLPA